MSNQTIRKMVVIGASLGGYDVLSRALANLDPIDTNATAIAIVLHRAASGPGALASQLGAHSSWPLSEPDDCDPLESGNVYLAPAGYHMLVENDRVRLSVDQPISHARPSIDALFQSAAESFGRNTVGIMLTASSMDGVVGMLCVRRAGGKTIVQAPETARSSTAINAVLLQFRPDRIIPGRGLATYLKTITSPTRMQRPRVHHGAPRDHMR